MYISAHSAKAYTATLLVRVNVVKGDGRAPPTLTSQANFTLMMECTPESGRYHSVVYTVCLFTQVRKEEGEANSDHCVNRFTYICICLHDDCLATNSAYKQLELTQGRSWGAPVKASIAVQNITPPPPPHKAPKLSWA